MTRRTRQSGATLLGVLAIAICYAQEPVVVRLRDAVGDTVDLAERDSFRLFPNTAGFDRAVMLALPGPEFYAEIIRTGADRIGHIFLRIMPYDLERIRFLIDNRAYVAEQQRSDSTYARALASFWMEVEAHPLRNMAGEPAIAQEVPPAPPEAAPAGEAAIAKEAAPAPTETAPAGGLQLQPVTSENRYNYTLHGATLGSIAGGLIGASIGVGGVASVALAAAGSYAGYRYGHDLDRKTVATTSLRMEGQSGRVCCTIGACVPGIALGVAVGSLFAASGSRELGWVPAVLSGACVTVEVVTLGYHIGHSIDRAAAR